MGGAMRAYYNEFDPYNAQWLRNLIAAGQIAPGDVDDRDIRDVAASDVVGYTQVHLFAGIGVWSYALRRAGWPDGRPVWTGSCPCQPFSTAGRRRGTSDERHLWPEFYRLIAECRPAVVFGEQVASQDGIAWLDLVQTDMETEGYAFGAAVLGAHSVGAPHIRQRIYFVADSDSGRFLERDAGFGGVQVADTNGSPDGVGHADNERLEGWGFPEECARELPAGQASLAGFWQDPEWVYCRDEKFRPVEPGTQPLAHGATARVGRLRAYGNAIVAPLATEFVRAYLEVGR